LTPKIPQFFAEVQSQKKDFPPIVKGTQFQSAGKFEGPEADDFENAHMNPF
jgi:hypothetical protein